jgi:ribonuclease BN (tRNA processing enzyme)
MGVRHVELDAVFLTHFHPDHTAELDSLLFAANYDESPRTGSLTIAGGPGLRGFLEALESAHGGWLTPRGYELKACELASGEEVRLGELACRTGSVQHIESSIAYRFELHHRSVAISGDTGPSSALEILARGVDLLIVEASLPEGRATTTHLTAGQAGELGRRAGARRLVLNHLYPAADREQPERTAAASFGGGVVVARDGMELAV